MMFKFFPTTQDARWHAWGVEGKGAWLERKGAWQLERTVCNQDYIIKYFKNPSPPTF